MITEQNLGRVEMVGESLVTLSAALWITRLTFVPYTFAIGAVIFAVARLQQNTETSSITLRRLYRQRQFGVIMLLLTAAVMFVQPGFYNVIGYNIHVGRTAWLISFVIFCIIELYTAFRIPYVIKKG